MHTFYVNDLTVLSSTCFEHPSVHPQEDVYMQFYAISFMHSYKQSGRRQNLQDILHILSSARLLDTEAHPVIDQTACYSSTSCRRPHCLILKHILSLTRLLVTRAHSVIDHTAWYSSTSCHRPDCLIFKHILPSTTLFDTQPTNQPAHQPTYELITQPTNERTMELRLAREANSFSAKSRMYPYIMQPEHYRIHKSPPLVPILNQTKQFHVLPIDIIIKMIWNNTVYWMFNYHSMLLTVRYHCYIIIYRNTGKHTSQWA